MQKTEWSQFTDNRKMLTYNFSANSGTANLSGEQYFLNYKLKMVDANGNETATAPVYYDLYMGNGYLIRYSKVQKDSEYYRQQPCCRSGMY